MAFQRTAGTHTDIYKVHKAGDLVIGEDYEDDDVAAVLGIVKYDVLAFNLFRAQVLFNSHGISSIKKNSLPEALYKKGLLVARAKSSR